MEPGCPGSILLHTVFRTSLYSRGFWTLLSGERGLRHPLLPGHRPRRRHGTPRLPEVQEHACREHQQPYLLPECIKNVRRERKRVSPLPAPAAESGSHGGRAPAPADRSRPWLMNGRGPPQSGGRDGAKRKVAPGRISCRDGRGGHSRNNCYICMISEY